MDSIGIITDSVACLPLEFVEKYQISIIPAGNIFYKGKTYRDMIDLNHVAVHRILESSPQEFFTGPTSPGEFIEIYRSLGKKHNAILYISLSAKFSTLCNVARLARDMVKKDLPDQIQEIVLGTVHSMIDSGDLIAAMPGQEMPSEDIGEMQPEAPMQ